MRVLIAGGGIAGLSAAIGLHRLGIEVLVLEQAPRFGAVGAGIVLAPNGMRALDWLGAGDHIRAVNAPVEALSYNDIVTGEEITRTQLGDRAAERFGRHLFTTHRSDLVEALAACLPRDCIRLNNRIQAIEEQANSVTVRLQDGEALSGDLLIGADGLKSTVRAHLHGQQDAVFTGSMAWRTVYRSDRLPGRSTTLTKVWAGPGRHVVRYPIRKGTEFYSAFYVPAAEIHRENWQVSGDLQELRASFADCCEEVAEILSAVEQAFITGIYYRDPITPWHRGRILLVGDAAHSVLPTSGSGSGLALEDAVMLAICFERHGAKAFEAAFSEFEARRWDRTTRVQVTSRADLDIFHETDPVQTAARNGRFRGVSQIDPLGEVRWSWIYTYDAERAAATTVTAMQDARRVENPLQRPGARRAFALWKGALTIEDNAHGWIGQRAGYERFLKSLETVRPGVEIDQVQCGSTSALRIVSPGGEDGAGILHCHGGGFVLGSAESSAALAARLACGIGGWALSANYRLAPEHPYPCALNDVRQAWQWLVARAPGVRVITGEGAGAGLALSLALQLRDHREALPSMIVLFSPMLDPLLKADSIDRNANSDPWHTRVLLTGFAGSYLQSASPADPYLSPLTADLSGLPPVRMWSAENEALFDDAKRLESAVRQVGGDVRLVAIPDSVPSFVLFDFLPETERAIDTLGREVRAQAALCNSAGSNQRSRRRS